MGRRPYFVSILFLILCFFVPLGCGTWVPERFVRPGEAYSSKDYLHTEQIPQDSFKKMVFQAPYENVFRTASVSASQAQLSIEEESKGEGVILATRIVQALPPQNLPISPGNKLSHQRNYYYAILVKEKGAKSTEVLITVKSQGKCLIDPLCNTSACKAYAIPHWATGHDHAMQDLNQFMIFLRNNLIAAGLI